MTHHRETAPHSRLRHWASRLALLVACAGVVATSRATSADVASEPYTGKPVYLTAETPKATIPLVMVATASKSPDKQAEAEMKVLVTARWTPADAGQTVRPVFRAVLREGGNDFSGPEGSSPLGETDSVTLEVHTYLSRDCTMGQRCEWTTDLDFELQPNGATGTVEVVWTATGSAHVVDTSSTPKGFKVVVSEP
ncbi:hypothetical protein JYK02_37605 [Corallococcus macrosporus]|uniref:Lipoprotein n=1 Tax=Corallococcus macrosporus TaxID=35 RepID=A0ABS3DPK0_9BACT|nr:hypothetical protein [Corallococcus macrosporus]MBN8233247.1 hypothetical protein [Corallococcus macrosporus]